MAGIFLLGMLFALWLVLANPAQARSAPDSFADLAERLLPSVVNISSTQIQKQERGPQAPNF
ncbi:MAG: serine protease, partial [Alphaproteobacteria bacterium]